ncbi:hypothetical protein [Bernardetia sp.]|uniref:hypothetical protein n=1 Tax=Bernardetia sp. TaxID=1937974 RepID=UPI0025C28E8E|nr:hypothetical protein [Bernardetia sp.]
MSKWTHVNASIRFDSILHKHPPLPTEKELGLICTINNGSEWENSFIPCGSEGSLRYNVIKNPNISDSAAMLVVFYGDLRDYDDEREIMHYFKDLVEGQSIRSAIIEIDIEEEGRYIYSYNQTDKVFDLIKCP